MRRSMLLGLRRRRLEGRRMSEGLGCNLKRERIGIHFPLLGSV